MIFQYSVSDIISYVVLGFGRLTISTARFLVVLIISESVKYVALLHIIVTYITKIIYNLPRHFGGGGGGSNKSPVLFFEKNSLHRQFISCMQNIHWKSCNIKKCRNFKKTHSGLSPITLFLFIYLLWYSESTFKFPKISYT